MCVLTDPAYDSCEHLQVFHLLDVEEHKGTKKQSKAGLQTNESG